MDYFVFDLSGPLPGDKKGYVSSLDTRIKVWDSSRTVKNLAIQGQEFDQITLSRSNHHAFGYQAQ